MYAIVKFLDESDAPGIVCTHWINKEEDYCQYPNVRTNEARDKLLRKLAEPAQDWVPCRIKILHKYNSFNEAVLYLPRAEETSNLDSEEESVDRSRKKFRRPITYPEEESDEECGPTLAKKKRVSKKTCNDIIIDPYPNPSESSTSLLQQQSSAYVPRTNIQIQANSIPDVCPQLGNPHSSPSSVLSHVEKSPACPSSQTMNNGKLVAWMADISGKLQTLSDKIDLVSKDQAKLLQQNYQVPESVERYEDLEILGSLPITNDESFMEINKKIAEESHLRKLLIKFLISVGGKDMRCHIHNMLRRLLSDDVAELYSLSGKSTLKNSIKKPFLGTEVSKTMFSACQRVFKDTATEVKMKEAVGDWLNQAKVRKIRRMQRHEKNMENNGE